MKHERPPPEGPVIRVARRSRQFGELARLISASPSVRLNVSVSPENLDTMRTLIRIPLETSDPELRRQSTPG